MRSGLPGVAQAVKGGHWPGIPEGLSELKKCWLMKE